MPAMRYVGRFSQATLFSRRHFRDARRHQAEASRFISRFSDCRRRHFDVTADFSLHEFS